MAGQKPDPQHPFGHGRIEYLSGLIVSAAVLIMAFELIKSSIEKILHPETIESSPLILIILTASILVKCYMAYYNRSLGKKLDSTVMSATAADSFSDMVSTSVVLLVTIASPFTDFNLDGWCGILVGIFIFYTGITSMKETIDPLLGQPPTKELVQQILDIVDAYPSVLGIHDLLVHDYGPGHLIISLHVEVSASGDILMIHDEIDNIERELKQALFLTILEAEAHLRSIFSYRFAEKYKADPYAYLNLSNYKNDNIDGMLSVIQTISKISRTIDCYKRRQEEGSIIHYLKKYKYVPIWVLINYLSFGELRTLLEKSPEDIQNNVARDCMDFVSQNIQGELEVFHPGTLCSFVANINEIRNICAHNNRIIGFKCHHDDKYWKPLHSKYHIVSTDLRRSAYSVFISLQCFVSQTEYGILHNTILKRTKTLSRNLRAISVNEILLKLGFPEDWHLKEQRLSQ